MKKIILASMLVLSFSAAFSQFEKGSNWIGGSGSLSLGKTSLGLQSGSSNDNNNFAFASNLSFNNFESDKIINTYFIGYSYSGSSTNNSNPSTTNNNGYAVSLGYGRTHTNPLFGKVYSSVTTNFSGQYGFTYNESTSSSGPYYYDSYTKKDVYSLNFNFSLGLLYKINNKFAITTNVNNIFNAAIQSSSSRSASTGTVETETKGFNIGGGFGLAGFSFSNLQFGLLYKIK